MPLALFGSIFGWGLKRNILDLYTFICRNYRPGDRIYAFGFSRGAFTIRVLVDLVSSEGILNGRELTERELAAYTRDTYRAYRRCFNNTGLIVSMLRRVRDVVIATWRRVQGLKPFSAVSRIEVDDINIEFVGLWDTVAAYGTPFAELTRGIDDWVWPLSLPHHILPAKVRTARHALALDDERDTFHPIPWDEKSEWVLINRGEMHTDLSRIQQVWFAGMHADVGGGYPDNSLALVSLNWMAKEASKAGLRFRAEVYSLVGSGADEFGPMHDSRHGVAGYYRYQPRKISKWLSPPDPSTLNMQDADWKSRTELMSVKVHESVLRRIAKGTDRYAPIVLPEHYEVVRIDGRIEPSSKVEADFDLREAASRVAQQEYIWDLVWWRRVTYFATVGVSLSLAFLPSIQRAFPPSACIGPQCLLTLFINGIGNFVPSFGQPWIQAFGRSPGLFVSLIAALAVLLLWSRRLQSRIQDEMLELWRPDLENFRRGSPSRIELARVGRPRRWVYRLRTGILYQNMFRTLKWKITPTVSGLLLLSGGFLLVLGLLAILAVQVDIALAEWTDGFCAVEKSVSRQQAPPNHFSTQSLCWSTSQVVDKGNRYRVVLRVTAPWVDNMIETTPKGFTSDRMPLSIRYSAPLLRRSLADRWFQPIAKVISADGTYHIHSLEMQQADAEGQLFSAEFQAANTGALFLYVNDAVLPSWWGDTEKLYENNKGEAEVRVHSVRP